MVTAHNGWDHNDDAANWIRNAYAYIAEWNNQPQRSVCAWASSCIASNQDEWQLDDKPMLLDAHEAERRKSALTNFCITKKSLPYSREDRRLFKILAV